MERNKRLEGWRIPTFPQPGYNAQRQYARTVIGNALQERVGLLTFYGDFGGGKTLALQIIVNEMRERHTVEGFYAPFGMLLDRLRGLYTERTGAAEFWQRILDVPVLAVDEVTRFRADSEWQQEQLFSLVDTRYRRRASHLTVFATNDDPKRRLPPEESVGYLLSRMREGKLIELRGDVRELV